MNHVGEDPMSAAILASPGGPLYFGPQGDDTLCSECEDEIDPGDYHVVARKVCCGVCALRLSSMVLDGATDRLTSDERQALDVLRKISREVTAGIWERTGK
jgi:hypothetical protein